MRFGADRLAMIDLVNAVDAEYRSAGYDLTLRQVYYQLVARGHIPNNERSYKNLGNIVNDGRLAGLIDWDAIGDRTRFLRANSHWGSPEDIIESAAAGYAIDKWQDQKVVPEVWVEKDALIGVVERAAVPLDVPYFSCRGYVSQSEMWTAAQRMLRRARRGQTTVVLHLGDHDPSGKDMTRDIADRLSLFLKYHGYRAIEVDRLALNMDQVERYDPPPNPATVTDSRAAAYIEAFGDESWELDALEPAVLNDLITRAVTVRRDDAKWAALVAEEAAQKADLELLQLRYTDAIAHLKNGKGTLSMTTETQQPRPEDETSLDRRPFDDDPQDLEEDADEEEEEDTDEEDEADEDEEEEGTDGQ